MDGRESGGYFDNFCSSVWRWHHDIFITVLTRCYYRLWHGITQGCCSRPILITKLDLEACILPMLQVPHVSYGRSFLIRHLTFDWSKLRNRMRKVFVESIRLWVKGQLVCYFEPMPIGVASILDIGNVSLVHHMRESYRRNAWLEQIKATFLHNHQKRVRSHLSGW